MSEILNAIRQCLTILARSASIGTAKEAPIVTEYKVDKMRTTQEIADDVLATLYSAEKPGRDLELALHGVIGIQGWTENLAAAILNGLERALKEHAPMGVAMKDAYDRAVGAVEDVLRLVTDFEREHPVLFWSVVAVGVLVVLAPWALEAIGFGELGPVEGSFAVWWQARYAGYVPKNSWFSFFQRLGMVWRRLVGAKTYLRGVEAKDVL